MMWVLLWVLLVLAAAALLGSLSWGVVRKALDLGRELGRSAERVRPVLQQLPEPYRPASSVLSDPTTVPATLSGPGRSRSGHRRSRAGHRRLTVDDGGRAAGRVG